jgi:hypothetical protein
MEENNWIMANVSLLRVNIEADKIEEFCKKVVLRRESDTEEPAEYTDDTVFSNLVDPLIDMYFVREDTLYKVVNLDIEDFAGSLDLVVDEDSNDLIHFQGIFNEVDFADLNHAINEAFYYNESDEN